MARGPRRASVLFAAVAVLRFAAGQQTISDGCSTFLNSLDADSTLSSCTSNLLNATAVFNPTTQAGSKQQPLATIQSTLVDICRSSIGFCDAPTMQTVLNQFSSACSNELVGASAVQSVIALYDALYVITPLRNAMCTTNPQSGNSCLLEIAGGGGNSTKGDASASAGALASSASANSSTGITAKSDIAPANTTLRTYAMKLETTFNVAHFAAQALTPANLYVQVSNSYLAKRLYEHLPLGRRAPNDTTSSGSASASASGSAAAPKETDNAPDPTSNIVTANATTFQSTNLAYLFLNPSMPNSELCTDCTQAVFAAYIAWESLVPYVAGLPNSLLLANQAQFWKAMGVKCGTPFLQQINTLAGQTQLDAASSALTSSPISAFVLAVFVASGAVLLQ